MYRPLFGPLYKVFIFAEEMNLNLIYVNKDKSAIEFNSSLVLIPNMWLVYIRKKIKNKKKHVMNFLYIEN